jgi:hypothetical protein
VFGGRSPKIQTNPQTISYLGNAETTSLPVSQPYNSAAVDNIASTSIAAPEAEWSVVHNHGVRQTLNVHLAHTFKVKSEVLCVKFSREGKYLAVGLKGGETYIYDVEALSNRFIPFYSLV